MFNRIPLLRIITEISHMYDVIKEKETINTVLEVKFNENIIVNGTHLDPSKKKLIKKICGLILEMVISYEHVHRLFYIALLSTL